MTYLSEYFSASVMQPGPGLHAVDFGFLVSETWIPVLIVNGIPDSKAHEFQIPQGKNCPEPGLCKQTYPGFRIPDSNTGRNKLRSIVILLVD